MKSLVLPCIALLTVFTLAGCMSEPQQKVVDFSNVDASQPGGNFELEVKVVGLRDGSINVPDAFVGVVESPSSSVLPG